MQDVGGIGPQGEYYFIPTKTPSLRAPDEALGKEGILPIFPRSQVLGPLGEEYIGIYEMRYRQLLNDVMNENNGIFGHSYYSTEFSKLALVGTLTRIKRMERLDDGGIYLLMEGIGRYYVKNVISEKPYLKARVQTFYDYVEQFDDVETLEEAMLDEVRYSIKIMKLLYPSNNYTLNDVVLRNKPFFSSKEDFDRLIRLQSEKSELKRRSRFSFAVMEMLKTDPVTKLVFVQEPIIEKRNAKILKVLEDSNKFLENELLKRGMTSLDALRKLREANRADQQDIESSSLYIPGVWGGSQNSKDDWSMKPVLMN